MTVLAQRNGVRVVAFNKCGHTSIINTFMHTDDYYANTVDRALALGGYQGDLSNFHDWPDPHTIIAFLRNPAARALSAYQHFFVRSLRPQLLELGFEEGMTFDEFVNHLCTVDLSLDAHLAPYTPDLVAAGGVDPVYSIAPLEMIDACWPLIMDDVGLADVVPLTVRHENKGDYYHGDYMTPGLYEMLCELYSEDFSLWSTVHDEARAEIQAIRNETH